MNIFELYYALQKQVPEDVESLTLDSGYGTLTLEGKIGKEANKAVRKVLESHYHKKLKKQRKKDARTLAPQAETAPDPLGR